MAYLNDEALDQGLDWIIANGTRIDLCSTEPTTYAQATSTYSLAYKTGITVGATQNGDTSGRKVTIPAVTGGTVSTSGTAAYWALTDGSSVLVATGAMTSSKTMNSGDTWSSGAADIEYSDPA